MRNHKSAPSPFNLSLMIAILALATGARVLAASDLGSVSLIDVSTYIDPATGSERIRYDQEGTAQNITVDIKNHNVVHLKSPQVDYQVFFPTTEAARTFRNMMKTHVGHHLQLAAHWHQPMREIANAFGRREAAFLYPAQVLYSEVKIRDDVNTLPVDLPRYLQSLVALPATR